MDGESRLAAREVGAAHVAALCPRHIADAVYRKVNRGIRRPGRCHLLRGTERLPRSRTHRANPHTGAVREGDRHAPAVRRGDDRQADHRSLAAVDAKHALWDPPSTNEA